MMFQQTFLHNKIEVGFKNGKKLILQKFLNNEQSKNPISNSNCEELALKLR